MGWTFEGKVIHGIGQTKKPLSFTNKGVFCQCCLNALLTVYHIWWLAQGWIQTNKREEPEKQVNSLCTCVCMRLIRVELVWLIDRNDAEARHLWWWHQGFDCRLESKHIFLLLPSQLDSLIQALITSLGNVCRIWKRTGHRPSVSPVQKHSGYFDNSVST